MTKAKAAEKAIARGETVTVLYPTDDGPVELAAEVRNVRIPIAPAHRPHDPKVSDCRLDLHCVLPGQKSKSTLMQIPCADRAGVDERMVRWKRESGGATADDEPAEG